MMATLKFRAFTHLAVLWSALALGCASEGGESASGELTSITPSENSTSTFLWEKARDGKDRVFRIDGVEVPFGVANPVSPGRHRIGTELGRNQFEETIEVEEGQRIVRKAVGEIQLQPATPLTLDAWIRFNGQLLQVTEAQTIRLRPGALELTGEFVRTLDVRSDTSIVLSIPTTSVKLDLEKGNLPTLCTPSIEQSASGADQDLRWTTAGTTATVAYAPQMKVVVKIGENFRAQIPVAQGDTTTFKLPRLEVQDYSYTANGVTKNVGGVFTLKTAKGEQIESCGGYVGGVFPTNTGINLPPGSYTVEVQANTLPIKRYDVTL